MLEGVLTAGALVCFPSVHHLHRRRGRRAGVDLQRSYQEAVGAAQRVFELLEMPPAIADPPDGRRCRHRCAVTSRSSASPSATGRRVPAVDAGRHLPCGSRRARWWRWSGPRARARRPWSRCCRASGTWTQGRMHARRPGRAPPAPGRPARRDRHRAAGAGALQRHDPREHRLRAAQARPRRRCRGGGAGGARARVRRAAAAGLRHAGGRARRQALAAASGSGSPSPGRSSRTPRC